MLNKKIITIFFLNHLLFFNYIFAQTEATSTVNSPEVSTEQILLSNITYVPSKKNLPAPCATSEIIKECPTIEDDSKYREFSIQLPVDWNIVYDDITGYAVVARPKQAEKIIYDPMNPMPDPIIQISVTRKQLPIDDKTLNEYGEYIKNSMTKNKKEDYAFQLFLKQYLTINTRQALLYYVTFVENKETYKQAFIVLSNEKMTFRIEYRDNIAFFDASLEKYWPVLTSIDVTGLPPDRNNSLSAAKPWIIGSGIIGLIFIVLLWIKKRSDSGLLEESIMHNNDDDDYNNDDNNKKDKKNNYKNSDDDDTKNNYKNDDDD